MSQSVQSPKTEMENIIIVKVNYQKLNNRTNKFEDKTRLLKLKNKLQEFIKGKELS